MNKINIIGLMTGTSCDGMDLCLIQCNLSNGIPVAKIVKTQYVEYSEKFSKSLLQINSSSIDNIAQYHMSLGKLWATEINNWVVKNKFKIDMIGIHGQTIYHKGKNASIQIGEPLYISKKLKVPVIHNFRTKDIINHGQGAPLMPIVDNWIFNDLKENVITLNIGGISNITIINKDKKISGFDTGPGMSLSDLYCLRFLSQKYDVNGTMALNGNIDINLVNKWIHDEKFILDSPPKSADKSLFGEEWLDKNINNFDSHENNLANLAYFTSLSISLNVKANDKSKNTSIYVSGGGIKNKAIMTNLSELLPKFKILSIAKKGIDPKYKEAYAFAMLAASNYFKIKVDTRHITGAKDPYIIGEKVLWS
mgnify:FL=1|tara:strand:+ start:7430 stop:8524 length:1095 start_codon:yes stop_codon:yes gene_type:complete